MNPKCKLTSFVSRDCLLKSLTDKYNIGFPQKAQKLYQIC